MSGLDLTYLIELGWLVLQVFIVIIPLLIGVAYLTLAERRVIGFMQLRKGPNVVGPIRIASTICRCS